MIIASQNLHYSIIMTNEQREGERGERERERERETHTDRQREDGG